MKKALQKRIFGMQQKIYEEKKKQVAPPISSKRVVTKDREGHVVKYLARRITQYGDGLNCDMCKENCTEELEFWSC